MLRRCVLLLQGLASPPSDQVDIWAAGILAFELLVGQAPFEDKSRQATFNNIVGAEVEFPAGVSLEAKSFIKAALCEVRAGREPGGEGPAALCKVQVGREPGGEGPAASCRRGGTCS